MYLTVPIFCEQRERQREMGDESSLHVAMLPWLAFGHMNPFIHLAAALSDAGLRISFLCTPNNNHRLAKLLPSHLLPRINFVDLPLPPVPGLRPQIEATADAAADEVQHLKTAYDLLQQPISSFIADSAPDFLIHDIINHWASALRVPCIVFSVYSAATLAFWGPPEASTEEGRLRWRPTPQSLTEPPEWIPFPSTVAFRQHEAAIFYAGVFVENASGVRDADRVRLAIEGCQAVAVRSCAEYEGEYLELLPRLLKKPVLTVGLLPPEAAQPATASGGGGDIISWLDRQPPKSVVFICFGSEYKLTNAEVEELAHGIEKSQVPFLWALRGFGEEALPNGFMGRISDRGLVSFGWVAQLEILAHASVGGSLFHSGWGSVIETMRYGHAMVLLPSMIDQGLNARLLVEKGLAIEVERGDADGSSKGEDVALALKTVMNSDEGERQRTRVREMANVFADGEIHANYVKGFVDYLLKTKGVH